MMCAYAIDLSTEKQGITSGYEERSSIAILVCPTNKFSCGGGGFLYRQAIFCSLSDLTFAGVVVSDVD
jgi:hypothetical protein